MNAKLRMYKYCYSNKGAIYAKGLYTEENDSIFATIWIYFLDYVTMWWTEITIFTKL